MEFMKIADFARTIGVAQNTLRSWDEKNILKPHHLMPNGSRIYSDEQVVKYFNGDYNGGEYRHLRVRKSERRCLNEEDM